MKIIIVLWLAIALDTMATDAAICCTAKRRFLGLSVRGVLTALAWPISDLLVIWQGHRITRTFPRWTDSDFKGPTGSDI